MNNKDEVVMTNILGSVVGIDTLLKGYFTNDSSVVVTALGQQTNNIDGLYPMLDNMNYNYKSRKHIGKSSLGKLQQETMQLFDLSLFKDHVITNPQMLDEPNINYPGLDVCKEHIRGFETSTEKTM